MSQAICSSCGKGAVEPVQKPGRRMRFRNFKALELPASLAIPTCNSCGEEWIDAGTTEALERALADAVTMVLTKLSEEAIQVLSEHCAQRDVEELLDLSRGYLSKVKHGKEKPSALLTALLALLARNPERRLDEVRRFWSTGSVGPRLVTTSTASTLTGPGEQAASYGY